MGKVRILLILGAICLVGACTDRIKETHEMDTKYIEGHLMRYESVGEAETKDGQTLMQLTLVGQPYPDNPTQTVNTKQQLVTTAGTTPAPPPQPVYGRAAKAVPRTPPLTCEPKQRVQTLTDVSRQEGPRTLANAKHGGETTKSKVLTGLAYTPAAAAIGVPQAFVPGTSIIVQGAKAVANPKQAQSGSLSGSMAQGQAQ